MTILDQEVITWNSVADALPDKDVTCLVCVDNDDSPVRLGYHNGEDWYDLDGVVYGDVDGNDESVTAWSAMPKGANLGGCDERAD